MRSILIAMLLFILPVRCHAPVSEFWKTLSIIYTACDEYHVNTDWELVMFNDESPGLKGDTVCEPKYIKKYYQCIKAHAVPQLLLRTAGEMGFKGDEKELDKNETAIPLATKFIEHLCRMYHSNMSKVISHYKSGSPKHTKFYERLLPKYKQLIKEMKP